VMRPARLFYRIRWRESIVFVWLEFTILDDQTSIAFVDLHAILVELLVAADTPVIHGHRTQRILDGIRSRRAGLLDRQRNQHGRIIGITTERGGWRLTERLFIGFGINVVIEVIIHAGARALDALAYLWRFRNFVDPQGRVIGI